MPKQQRITKTPQAKRQGKKRKSSESLTGSTSANFHEGTRSEYLAHYVLASFGTAIPIPSREDTGLDLQCTLTERIGQRIWPVEYYSVQVKSTEDDWHFGSPKSVEWLIKHPLPVFLCVVTKREARLRFYHTIPRYSVWATPGLPKAITLRPGKASYEGTIEEWDSQTEFCLGSPILDFDIKDAASEANVKSYADVLRSWIRIDKENLYRISANIRVFQYPNAYLTNVALHDYNDGIAEGTKWKPVRKANYEIASDRVIMALAWLTFQQYERGDVSGAIKGLLLLRHLVKGELPKALAALISHLNSTIGTGTSDIAGIDVISNTVDEFALKASRILYR